MVCALLARGRRFNVFSRRLSAYVPRADVRVLPKSSRVNLDSRHGDICGIDGGGIFRLLTSVGQYVVLGSAGHYFVVWRDTGHRRTTGGMDSRGFRSL